MFKSAIVESLRWTSPIFTIVRYIDDTDVVPGAATLMVVNADGWVLTCKHVLNELLAAEQVAVRRAAFLADKSALGPNASKHSLKKLKAKHGYDAEPVYELLHQLSVVDTFSGYTYHAHPDLDLALIKITGFTQLRVSSFPTFSAAPSPPAHGEFLCRVGFPFPEFTHFHFDAATDSIGWNAGASSTTPYFPLEGMVTRHLRGAAGDIFGFEMSTPGLRGQSGGPVVDAGGVVHGMQFETAHLDLNFDVKTAVRRGPSKPKVTSTPFLHVGRAISAHAICAFMTANGVTFQSGAPVP